MKTLLEVQKLVNESRLQLKSNGKILTGTVGIVHAFDKVSFQRRDAFSFKIGENKHGKDIRRFYWVDKFEHYFNIL